MKKIYLKFKCVSSVRLLGVVLLLIAVINSCKKDEKQVTSAIATANKINEAKEWYLKTFPVITDSSNAKITQGTGSNESFDYSQILKPDWAKALTYNRLNNEVVEMPLDSAAKLAFVDKNVNLNTSFNFDKSYSKSSFLILKDGNNYNAYIMTIVADSAYLKNDFRKLSNNTYRKHDKDFSGDLIYYTPKGEFVSGWHYANGKINRTIAITKNYPDGFKTQSIGSSKLKTQGCSITVYYHLTIGYVNGFPATYFYDFTVHISCDYVPGIDPNLDGDGYIPPSGGGGGGGGTTTTTQTQKTSTTDTSILLNNPKLSCINNKLTDNSVYNNLISKFLTGSTYNLLIRAAPLNSNDLGVTTYNPNLQNGNVTITINTNQISVAAIDIATTFIHEAFHAYIAQNLIQRSIMGTNVYNQTYADTFDQYVTAQVDSVRSARMALNQPFDSNTVSHDIIAANIDIIANGIKQYAELAWPALKTDPSITFANYRATAWASKGLAGSTSYAKEFDTAEKIEALNSKRNAITQSTTLDCN